MRVQLEVGRRLSHCTTLESARSILKNGIRLDVPRLWGGVGPLGEGLYVSVDEHETQEPAYLGRELHVALRFVVVKPWTGLRIAKPSVSKATINALKKEFDFFQPDLHWPADTELCVHRASGHLRVVGVYDYLNDVSLSTREEDLHSTWRVAILSQT